MSCLIWIIGPLCQCEIHYFALALLAPSLGVAQSCTPTTAANIPVFEAAKTAFLKTDCRVFASLVDDYIPDMNAQFDTLFGPLEVFGPQGYDRCRTILQRREEPSFLQEIVFYFHKGSDKPLALHLVGAEVDDAVHILEFTYNSSISAVLDGLR